MSTPGDPQNPQNPRYEGSWTTPGVSTTRGAFGTGDFADEASRARATDTSAITEGQLQGTEALINTLLKRVTTLQETVLSFPEAFASTAEHIKRSADATEKLASASRKVADQQERGEKATKNTTASLKDVVTALASGNLQGAIGELFQTIPGTSGLRERLSARAARARVSEFQPIYGPVNEAESLAGKTTLGNLSKDEAIARARPGTIGSLARAGIAGRTAALGLEMTGGLLTPAAIYGAYRTFNAVNQQRQEEMRTGALTGEGAGVGLAAGGINVPIFGRIGGEAYSIRGSAFDLVSSREAMEIVQGVRGAGIRGDSARNTEEAIAGMINDLGIGVQDAMNIAVPAIRDVGMTTGELSAQMQDLDKSARDSGSGIASLQKAIADLLPALAMESTHVAKQAVGAIEDFQREFEGLSVAKHPERFGKLFGPGKGREALAILSGFSPFQVYDPAFADYFKTNFNKQLLQIAMMNWDVSRKQPLMSWQAFVHMVILPNPLYAQLFEGFAADDIAGMLKKALKQSEGGTHPEKFIQAEANKNRARDAAVRSQSISDDFKQLMKRKTSTLSGIWSGTGTRWVGDIFGNSGGVDRSLIRKRGSQAEKRIEGILANLGLSDEARADILDPIKKAVKAGNRGDVEKALDRADKQIEAAQSGGQIHVKVGFDPHTQRYLKVQDSGTLSAQRGQRGTQGTLPHR